MPSRQHGAELAGLFRAWWRGCGDGRGRDSRPRSGRMPERSPRRSWTKTRATMAAGRCHVYVPRLPGAAGRRSRRGGLRTNCAKGVCVDALHGSRAILSLNCPVGCGFVSGLFARPHDRWPRWVSTSRSSHFTFALNAHPLARAISGCRPTDGPYSPSPWPFGSSPVPLILPHAACGAADW